MKFLKIFGLLIIWTLCWPWGESARSVKRITDWEYVKLGQHDNKTVLSHYIKVKNNCNRVNAFGRCRTKTTKLKIYRNRLKPH